VGDDLHGAEFGLLIQRLGEGQGRLHLDVHTDDLEAEVARLEGLGATTGSEGPFLVDPARSGRVAVCVVPESADSLNDGSARRWD
jgi:Glyoxalase-like domain